MLVLTIPICVDPAYQLKNVPLVVPFKETKRKRRQISTSLTPRTKTLSHGHNMSTGRRRRDLSGANILRQLLKSLLVSAENDAIVRKLTAI